MAAEASSSTAETAMVMEAPNVCFNSNSSANEEERGKKKAEGDVPRRSHLLHPYYRPQISEEELLKLSEDSRPLLKPLFEKILRASAEGRRGRLVIPKKLAEAYFPPISCPEGVPLKVHDLEGKEWVFRFRFWPNNNSRLYVIEGITPYIQSMQLQAGDTLIFSRLVPEGKLVVGCRKKSDTSPEKTKDGVQGRSQLLRPYRPWMNDKELQKISEDSTSVIETFVSEDGLGVEIHVFEDEEAQIGSRDSSFVR